MQFTSCQLILDTCICSGDHLMSIYPILFLDISQKYTLESRNHIDIQ